MAGLYEISKDFAYLSQILADCETEEEVEQIVSQFDSVESDMVTKYENIARILLNLKAHSEEMKAKADIFHAEGNRLDAIAKSDDSKQKRLKEYLLFNMQVAGLNQVKTSIGKFYTQTTMSVDVKDAWAVPERFTVPQPPKVDKDAIKRAFKETGELFEGVEIKITNGVRFR